MAWAPSPSALSWFGQLDGPFLVPADLASAGRRSEGQGRPPGRRGPRLALDARKPPRTLPTTRRETDKPRVWRATIALLCCGVLFIPVVATSAPGNDAAPTSGSGRVEIADAVREASLRFGLPERWIRAVILAESGGDRLVTSSKGAMGLMQVMPETWKALRADHGLGGDPFDVRDNVLGGSAYLRQLYDQFGFEGSLAAYNAGPGRYVAFREGRSLLPAETVAYVTRVRRSIRAMEVAEPSTSLGPVLDWRRSGLFVDSKGGPLTPGPIVAVQTGPVVKREGVQP
jgi:soluble lytic murein transglycosylase-like protein